MPCGHGADANPVEPVQAVGTEGCQQGGEIAGPVSRREVRQRLAGACGHGHAPAVEAEAGEQAGSTAPAGFYVMDGTAASLYRETLKQYAAQTVTYKKLGMDRFVVSGIHDRKVFYRVGTTAGKGDTQTSAG